MTVEMKEVSEVWNAEATRDMAHWRGVGRWSDTSWFKIGENTFRFYSLFCKYLDRETKTRNILEWGSGGGANAYRFCRECEDYFCVDISKNSLDECAKQTCGKIVPCLIDPANPESVLDLGLKIDVILSTAVFQHFPSQEYGYKILKVFKKLLAKDGIAIIAIRHFDGNPRYASKQDDYSKRYGSFTSYESQAFWKELESLQLIPEYVRYFPVSSNAYFFVRNGD